MTTGVFDNDQQTLVLTQAITLQGDYPLTDGSTTYADDFPIGMIRTFAFRYAAPGTVAAQGQTETVQQNSAPFSVIGSTYGGNGTTTFDLPNLAGRVEVGATSTTRNLGTAAGQDQTTITQAQLPPVLGGTSQAISDLQPSLAVTYMIRAMGDAPTTSTVPTGGFTGEIDAFAGSFTPDGFLVANGQTVSVSQYPALFAVIGYTYGGSGASFALPNLTGRDIVGASSTLVAGTVVGQQSVTLTNANAPVADGGQGVAFNNEAPGLVLNYLIATSGLYPPSDGSGGESATAPYLGEVRAYAGSVSQIPDGWALANGQILSIANNEPLFSLLGTTYGGNGTTTFALPNLANTVVAGSGGNYYASETYGQNNVTLQPSDIQCFHAGTRILTANGERSVESLQVGDTVATVWDGVTTSSRVVWVGDRHVDIARHPDPSRVQPIRFAPGAISDGQPSRPLFLSPDHALLLDGVLVAARQLINGTSITVENAASAHYFHVELEHHAILLADGVLAESYLDTGHRHNFAGGNAVSLHACFDRADHPGACTKLVTDAATVQPIWQRLANRIGPLQVTPTTRDSELVLSLGCGAIIAPHHVDAAGLHSFWFDGTRGLDGGTVTLRSRAQSPASLRPWLDDRRRLGVAVSTILAWTVDGGLDPVAVRLDPANARSGWWPAERGETARWTNGEAILALPPGCLRLDVQLAATAEYECAA